MVQEDQDARKEIFKTPSPDAAALRRLADIDRKNTARMKEIIENKGWPGKSLVGGDGAHAAWLLVQHADREPRVSKTMSDVAGTSRESTRGFWRRSRLPD